MRLLLVLSEVQIKYGSYGFQHGLAALSAYIRKAGGHQVALCYIGPSWKPELFREQVRRFRPHVIGFYTTEDQARFSRKLLREPGVDNAFTLFGGPYATLNPEILEEEPRLDALCVGEGEIPLSELLGRLEGGSDPADVAGLWVRRGADIVRNPPPPFLQDLDALPPCDRSLFEETPEIRHVGITQISFRNSFRVSRGCPYGCTFCSNGPLSRAQDGRFTRFRSVPAVLAEIDEVTARYRPQEIYFEDDSFTLNETFVDAFVDAYPRTSDLPFEFFSHIGPSTLGVLTKLRSVGGRRVSFGIESGNEALRRKVLKKRFSNELVLEVFRGARRMGYQVEAFVMAGLPDETPESFGDTAALLRRIDPDLYSVSIYFPFRGTELYAYAMKKRYLNGPVALDDDFVSRRRALLDMPDFPPAVVEEEVRRLPMRVYRGISLRKALLFRVYETRFGDQLLQRLAPLKRALRIFAVGGLPGALRAQGSGAFKTSLATLFKR